jgi:hypothetical protein
MNHPVQDVYGLYFSCSYYTPCVKFRKTSARAFSFFPILTNVLWYPESCHAGAPLSFCHWSGLAKHLV